MLSCFPPGSTPSAGMIHLGIKISMITATAIPTEIKIAFAFFERTIKKARTSEGTTTYTPAFFVKHVSNPQRNSPLMTQGLVAIAPFVLITSTKRRQKAIRNRTEIMSFAREQNITGNTGNSAKKASST